MTDEILQKIGDNSKFVYIVTKSIILTIVTIVTLYDFIEIVINNITIMIIAIATFYIVFMLFIYTEKK